MVSWTFLFDEASNHCAMFAKFTGGQSKLTFYDSYVRINVNNDKDNGSDFAELFTFTQATFMKSSHPKNYIFPDHIIHFICIHSQFMCIHTEFVLILNLSPFIKRRYNLSYCIGNNFILAQSYLEVKWDVLRKSIWHPLNFTPKLGCIDRTWIGDWLNVL